jgi:hypothetical protein
MYGFQNFRVATQTALSLSRPKYFSPKKLILNILHIKTKQNKKTNVHHKRRNRYNLQAEHEEIQKTTFCSNLAEPLALPHPVPQILPLAFLWEWREA